MNKEEIIRRYSEAAWDEKQEQVRQWKRANPEKVEEHNHERNRKGGKYYPKSLIDDHTGLRGERSKVRYKDGRTWREYKRIIAPDSQLHHEWIPGTANYKGVALVEKDQHMHGIVDVIQVLDGEIKVFTEKEIREKGKSPDGK